MFVSGVTTCVNYADLLSKGLPVWKDTIDDLLVVTRPDDKDTLALCDRLGVRSLATLAFERDGAVFNKAAALEEGLSLLNPKAWCLFFDADIIPPTDWKKELKRHKLRPGNLYGMRRRLENGSSFRDAGINGFFQLWHVSDPHAQDRPLLGSWHNASCYDVAFAQRWEKRARIVIPIFMTHQGEPAKNWLGRGKGGVDELKARWKAQGHQQGERLDSA